ncbi:hypothetical protein JZ751_023849 [Albula glossodonta]|uniref:Uncharacterized protein n=1 Tax=Albula glossodonta TaxID=121402 RepID=A0A8T2NHU8_9TELE|nr:hypothetical protein JZ751_023849 [Albula glossodonta]
MSEDAMYGVRRGEVSKFLFPPLSPLSPSAVFSALGPSHHLIPASITCLISLTTVTVRSTRLPGSTHLKRDGDDSHRSSFGAFTSQLAGAAGRLSDEQISRDVETVCGGDHHSTSPA